MRRKIYDGIFDSRATTLVEFSISGAFHAYFFLQEYVFVCRQDSTIYRECISMGGGGAQTCRSLGHHLLHPLILRVLLLCTPLILRPRAIFYRTDCPRRSKFLTHALDFWEARQSQWWPHQRHTQVFCPAFYSSQSAS